MFNDNSATIENGPDIDGEDYAPELPPNFDNAGAQDRYDKYNDPEHGTPEYVPEDGYPATPEGTASGQEGGTDEVVSIDAGYSHESDRIVVEGMDLVGDQEVIEQIKESFRQGVDGAVFEMEFSSGEFQLHSTCTIDGLTLRVDTKIIGKAEPEKDKPETQDTDPLNEQVADDGGTEEEKAIYATQDTEAVTGTELTQNTGQIEGTNEQAAPSWISWFNGNEKSVEALSPQSGEPEAEEKSEIDFTSLFWTKVVDSPSRQNVKVLQQETTGRAAVGHNEPAAIFGFGEIFSTAKKPAQESAEVKTAKTEERKTLSKQTEKLDGIGPAKKPENKAASPSNKEKPIKIDAPKLQDRTGQSNEKLSISSNSQDSKKTEQSHKPTNEPTHRTVPIIREQSKASITLKQGPSDKTSHAEPVGAKLAEPSVSGNSKLETHTGPEPGQTLAVTAPKIIREKTPGQKYRKDTQVEPTGVDSTPEASFKLAEFSETTSNGADSSGVDTKEYGVKATAAAEAGPQPTILALAPNIKDSPKPPDDIRPIVKVKISSNIESVSGIIEKNIGEDTEIAIEDTGNDKPSAKAILKTTRKNPGDSKESTNTPALTIEVPQHPPEIEPAGADADAQTIAKIERLQPAEPAKDTNDEAKKQPLESNLSVGSTTAKPEKSEERTKTAQHIENAEQPADGSTTTATFETPKETRQAIKLSETKLTTKASTAETIEKPVERNRIAVPAKEPARELARSKQVETKRSENKEVESNRLAEPRKAERNKPAQARTIERTKAQKPRAETKAFREQTRKPIRLIRREPAKISAVGRTRKLTETSRTTKQPEQYTFKRQIRKIVYTGPRLEKTGGISLKPRVSNITSDQRDWLERNNRIARIPVNKIRRRIPTQTAIRIAQAA